MYFIFLLQNSVTESHQKLRWIVRETDPFTIDGKHAKILREEHCIPSWSEKEKKSAFTLVSMS